MLARLWRDTAAVTTGALIEHALPLHIQNALECLFPDPNNRHG